MTKKTTLKELGDMLSHVVKHMATKDDLADLRKEMATKDDIADVKSTLADHTKILNDHTRDLAIIKKDLTTNLDKRLQLEVRVSHIEKSSIQSLPLALRRPNPWAPVARRRSWTTHFARRSSPS